MKKYVIAMVTLLIALIEIHPVSADVAHWDYDGLYARATVITEIEYGEDGINLITVQECNGFVYQYYDDAEDLCVGDVMSCIFDENGTEIVTDDIIVSARYDRIDLLPTFD